MIWTPQIAKILPYETTSPTHSYGYHPSQPIRQFTVTARLTLIRCIEATKLHLEENKDLTIQQEEDHLAKLDNRVSRRLLSDELFEAVDSAFSLWIRARDCFWRIDTGELEQRFGISSSSKE